VSQNGMSQWRDPARGRSRDCSRKKTAKNTAAPAGMGAFTLQGQKYLLTA